MWPSGHCTTAKGGRKRKGFHEVNRTVMGVKELMRVRKSKYVCLNNLNKLVVKILMNLVKKAVLCVK